MRALWRRPYRPARKARRLPCEWQTRVALNSTKPSSEPTRSRINLPDWVHYTYAEMGNGNTTARAGIELDFNDSYGQFNVLHLNQDGIIR